MHFSVVKMTMAGLADDAGETAWQRTERGHLIAETIRNLILKYQSILFLQ